MAREDCGIMIRFITVLAGAALLTTASLGAQDAKLVDTGKKLFTSKQCMTCHMIAGKGNKVGVLDGVAAKVNAADMKTWLTKPATMEAKLAKPPLMKMSSKIAALKLTDADINALVAYLQTLK